MAFRSHAALCCPLDGLPLEVHEGSVRCPNKHVFDIAKQGYVNLLSAQDKRSKDPGDSQAMIAARHRFLEAGHYAPVADCIADLLLPLINHESVIVDAGCGEAYYLGRLRESIFGSGGPEPQFIGFDISKWAMQTAARRFSASWLVASNRNIPLRDASVDILIDMFGFPDFASFHRIIKPGGLMLRVHAGANHLLELRQIIYPELKERTPSATIPDGFSVLQKQHLGFTVSGLGRQSIGDLLLMTPHLFRASADGKRRAAALESLSPSVDVSLELLKRD
ncbi:methyltransferase domain-containing protein [Congregibacter variabilis]|uniref:Methyltransferase domain-containing protein n=1 Tax=Congregibacter variabilis TaxID=3081200 RepID=A0ABZ0I8Q6_9GAMM|nr:methyltransferase domain-containing protein [Congregibacter sp. IMCC43200]